jgi:hypothetical protein
MRVTGTHCEAGSLSVPLPFSARELLPAFKLAGALEPEDGGAVTPNSSHA